jgi:hypothetical protein
VKPRRAGLNQTASSPVSIWLLDYSLGWALWVSRFFLFAILLWREPAQNTSSASPARTCSLQTFFKKYNSFKLKINKNSMKFFKIAKIV